MKRRNYKIPIHWLHSQGYCEYQIYLEHVKGIKVAPTPEMNKGKEIHSLLEENHKKKAKLKLSTKDALEKSQKEKIILIGREVPVSGNYLYGLIDEVHFTPNRIVIIDDKPNNYPYMTNKKQVWGYCLAFEEQFRAKLPLVACIRHRDTKRIIWKEIFSDVHKNIVLESVERILGIINQDKKAEPTNKVNRCKSCRLKEVCDIYRMRVQND